MPTLYNINNKSRVRPQLSHSHSTEKSDNSFDNWSVSSNCDQYKLTVILQYKKKHSYKDPRACQV